MNAIRRSLVDASVFCSKQLLSTMFQPNVRRVDTKRLVCRMGNAGWILFTIFADERLINCEASQRIRLAPIHGWNQYFLDVLSSSSWRH